MTSRFGLGLRSAFRPSREIVSADENHGQGGGLSPVRGPGGALARLLSVILSRRWRRHCGAAGAIPRIGVTTDPGGQSDANGAGELGIEINYEVHGHGNPMVLIPYLAADQACYAFQVGEYEKHYTCYCVDLRGAGLSSKPEGASTRCEFVCRGRRGVHGCRRDRVGARLRGLARRVDRDVAGGPAPGAGQDAPVAQRVGQDRPVPRGDRPGLAGHGAGSGQRDRDGHPGDLPVHGLPRRCTRRGRITSRRWPRSCEGGRCRRWTRSCDSPGPCWRTTPSEALASIQKPTLITYGRHDIVHVDALQAKPLSAGIADSEVHVFENCAHAAIYEDVEGFNERTLGWLQRHSS